MFRSAILLTGLVLSLSNPAFADQFTAKVVSVVDGDTLNVLHDDTHEKVILYGIDCPELGQEFGTQAREFTDQCCYNKVVTVQSFGKDKFGRTRGEIILSDGADLNQELVKRGLAWWSDKFAPDNTGLRDLQANAKAQHTGLWASPNPIPPWIYRNGDKSVKATVISK